MSIIDTLICDREQADVARWSYLQGKDFAIMTAQERSEWHAGSRGAYNPAKDMNRVAQAMEYLAQLLRDGGHGITIDSRCNWAVGDIPTAQDLSLYLADLQKLRAACSFLKTTPPLPTTMERLSYQQANHIEQILVDAQLVLDSLSAVMLRAAQPMLRCGFALHLPREYFAVATAEDLDVYTAEGALVFAR